MKSAGSRILTINGGSSSIKFALFEVGEALRRILGGELERIGLPEATLRVKGSNPADNFSRPVTAADHTAAVGALMEWIEEHSGRDALAAVGHRVVHGGPKYSEPQRVTAEMVEELHRISPFDPEHLPGEIELIEAFRDAILTLPQVACFDTAFHRTMPRVATDAADPAPLRGAGRSALWLPRFVVCISHGGTRPPRRPGGDEGPRDPRPSRQRREPGGGARRQVHRHQHGLHPDGGIGDEHAAPAISIRAWSPYLARTEQMSAEQFHEMVNHESGLLGVSETSSDMRDLLERETQDVRAAEAVALFCYQVKKWIGAFAAALGGLDTLVFAGGIGENAPPVRARICDGLGFLGIELDEERNAATEGVISTDASRVTVRVIRTDEELMIAQDGLPRSRALARNEGDSNHEDRHAMNRVHEDRRNERSKLP